MQAGPVAESVCRSEEGQKALDAALQLLQQHNPGFFPPDANACAKYEDGTGELAEL